MSVVIETTLGDITVDLFLQQRPVTCLNFLKLCKMKYYNLNLFHSIRSGFIAQTGDPTGEGTNGESIFGVLEGREKRFFSGEKLPKIRHTNTGTLSMVCTGDMMVGSQFFFTLAPDLDSLDSMHCVIGEVTEGHDVLRKLNDVICDEKHRPYRDVRITHTVILEDPFNDPRGFHAPSRSPSPSAERLKGGRIAPDEDIDEAQGKSAAEIQEMIEEKEAKARATILEIVGDLPDADIAPPENVLFVCKLNPVTTDEDLEIIFSRFGTIVGCEVIRDKKTGDSLQYAFVEFSDKKSCEEAYFKMDNVLIDDRRIHVDFSQSVSKMRYLGKGRGVQYFNDVNDSNLQGKSNKDINRNNNGDYENGKTDKRQENKDSDKNGNRNSKHKRSRSRERDRKRSSRRERSRSRRNRSRSRVEKSRSRRERSRSRSKRTSKSSRHRKNRSSSRSRIEKSHDRRRDRKSSPKKSRSDRKSSRDRRLRSPSPYSRHSRSRTKRSHDSKRGSERKSKSDKSYEKKRGKSTSRSRSNSRTATQLHYTKTNDKKEVIQKLSMPERPLESSIDDLTGSQKNIIPSRSRSKSQDKGNLSNQNEILINHQAESIKVQEIPVEKMIVTNVRQNDLKANYNTYWRKSVQEANQEEQISNIALNTTTTTTKNMNDKSRDKMDKHKVSRWERPQESNLQDDQINNEIEETDTKLKRLEVATLQGDQNRDEKYETSNWGKPREPYTQVQQTIDNEEKSETLKWRRLQDKTTQEQSDRFHSKSRSKSPIKKEKKQIKDTQVLDKVSKLETKQQDKSNTASRSRSKSPESRLEQQLKSQSSREKITSESKSDRTRTNSSNSNETQNKIRKTMQEYVEDDRKSFSKLQSAKLDESPQNDIVISRSRSKSYENTHKEREKSLEPTPEIESRKLSKKHSSKRDVDKKSHKEKKLKHHKETTKVSQKSEKKHKKNKELSSPVTKKKHRNDKKSKKVAKKNKRKHSTSSSSESSDSSSSSESSSSSDNERKKRSLKRRKKKLSTSSSSDSSTTTSSSSSSSTSSTSSDSEPSKKKRKKVISSKASKKGKKKQ